MTLGVASVRLVKPDDCGERMHGERETWRVRLFCSCNLLPNLDRAVAYEPVVLRLVVSVANSWGNLRRLCAQISRFAWRTRLPRKQGASRMQGAQTAASRTCLSRCLDDVICYWGTPAPAAQSSRVVDFPMAASGWSVARLRMNSIDRRHSQSVAPKTNDAQGELNTCTTR